MEDNSLNICKIVAQMCGGCIEDTGKGILWKRIDEKWIGKRYVQTKGLSSKWLEEVNKEDIKTWPCGEGADYNEIFYK